MFEIFSVQRKPDTQFRARKTFLHQSVCLIGFVQRRTWRQNSKIQPRY